MGQRRAGVYTYDCSENLAGTDIHSAGRTLSEFQHLGVGDAVPTDPSGERFTVAVLEPNRSLVLVANTSLGHVSVALILEALSQGRTPLICRPRGSFEPGDFIMMRKMLLGIKERAERGWSIQRHEPTTPARPTSARKRPRRLLGLFFKVLAHLRWYRMADVLVGSQKEGDRL